MSLKSLKIPWNLLKFLHIPWNSVKLPWNPIEIPWNPMTLLAHLLWHTTQVKDKGCSILSRGFFTSDLVEMKYLKIEIIHWAIFLHLVLIFVTFLVKFWKKIYEIKFVKEIYEIIFFSICIIFSTILAIIWAFTAFWEINSDEIPTFWKSTLI